MPKPMLFVISPIGQGEIRRQANLILDEYIKPAVKDLYDARRSDQIHADRISASMLWSLDNSPLVVAYVGSGNPWNPNVFFEIGYRMASEKRMVLIKHAGPELPFDLKDYSMVELPPFAELERKDANRDKELRKSIRDKVLSADRHIDSPCAVAELSLDTTPSRPLDEKVNIFTAASKEANRLFHIPPGESIIGRDPEEVMLSLQPRIEPLQWQAFCDEQDRMLGQLLGGFQRVVTAKVPFIFRSHSTAAEGGKDFVAPQYRGQAYLAIIYAHDQLASSLRLRILYLQVPRVWRWDDRLQHYTYGGESADLEDYVAEMAKRFGGFEVASAADAPKELPRVHS